MEGRRAAWDTTLTVVLAVLLAVAAGVGGLLGALLALVGDSCGVVECRGEQLTAGVVVAMLGPAVVTVVAVVALVRRLTRGLMAFWVPLVALAVAALVWLAGAALAVGAVPGFTV